MPKITKRQRRIGDLIERRAGGNMFQRADAARIAIEVSDRGLFDSDGLRTLAMVKRTESRPRQRHVSRPRRTASAAVDDDGGGGGEPGGHPGALLTIGGAR